jgi:hypothetical protein
LIHWDLSAPAEAAAHCKSSKPNVDLRPGLASDSGWRALTQVPPIEGCHRFNFRGDPNPHWNGVTDCEVLVVQPNWLLALYITAMLCRRLGEVVQPNQPFASGGSTCIRPAGLLG